MVAYPVAKPISGQHVFNFDSIQCCRMSFAFGEILVVIPHWKLSSRTLAAFSKLRFTTTVPLLPVKRIAIMDVC